MGLKLTLSKENNCLCTEFKDAYWVVTNIVYSLTTVSFNLICYPSREARHLNNTPMATSSLPVGGPSLSVAKPELYRGRLKNEWLSFYPALILYRWHGQFAISSIFPYGIPIKPDDQMRILYSFVKAYIGLAFDDVLEQGQEV